MNEWKIRDEKMRELRLQLRKADQLIHETAAYYCLDRSGGINCTDDSERRPEDYCPVCKAKRYVDEMLKETKKND